MEYLEGRRLEVGHDVDLSKTSRLFRDRHKESYYAWGKMVEYTPKPSHRDSYDCCRRLTRRFTVSTYV